jgi:hypothetical protein
LLDRFSGSRKSVGMNIDTFFLTNEFTGYARSFYTEDPFVHENIVLKEDHTHRVCSFARCIASSIGLCRHDIDCAYLSALFHDIGRFKQFAKYQTFRDNLSENHASLGIRVIEKKSFLKSLSPEDRILVVEAVRNHNRISVDENLDERIKLHARILRDSDKLDIIALHLDYFERRKLIKNAALEAFFPDEPGYTSEIIDLIMQSAQIPHTLRKNYNDFILTQLSWLLDLNFPFSLSYVLEHNYARKILIHLPEDDTIVKAVDHVLSEIIRRQKNPFRASRE